jgi:hypothetical protein
VINFTLKYTYRFGSNFCVLFFFYVATISKSTFLFRRMAYILHSIIVFVCFYALLRVRENPLKIKNKLTSQHNIAHMHMDISVHLPRHAFTGVHCKENLIYVFLFWELRGLSTNFHIHVSMSDLYIPRIGPHIFLQQNSQIDRGNIQIAPTHMNVENGLWLYNCFSGNICFEFSVLCKQCKRQRRRVAVTERTLKLLPSGSEPVFVPFKEPRNRFQAWRASTTTLFVVLASFYIGWRNRFLPGSINIYKYELWRAVTSLFLLGA